MSNLNESYFKWQEKIFMTDKTSRNDLFGENLGHGHLGLDLGITSKAILLRLDNQ